MQLSRPPVHYVVQGGFKHFIISLRLLFSLDYGFTLPYLEHVLYFLFHLSIKNMLIFRTDFTKLLQMHISSYHQINHSFKYFHIPKMMIDVPFLELPLMPDHKRSLIWYLSSLWLEYKMPLTDSYIEHLDSSHGTFAKLPNHKISE